MNAIRTALCLILCAAGLRADAQDDRLLITVDRNPAGVNDQVVLKITLRNANGRLERPDLTSFTVLSGPMTSNSTQIINGRTSTEYSETYVLRPRTQGTFKIGPARAAVGNEVLVSNVVELKVQQGTAAATNSSADFFVRAEVSKKSAYVGEGIQLVFKMFSIHQNIERIDQADYPDLSGFWSEEIDIGQLNWDQRKEVVNGKAYNMAVLRKVIIYPQHSGQISISSFDMSCVARINRGFWDTRKERFSASTQPISISVKALPAGKPDNFLGTFDNLSLTLTADRQNVKTNEAIDINLKFSGKGNFKTLGNIDLQFPDDFELYEPNIKDNLSLTEAGQSGTRTFNYLVIPRVAGQYAIEGIKYSWFDYKTGTYRVLDPGVLNFDVVKGADDGGSSYSINPKSQVNILSTDVRYIITQVDCLSKPGGIFYGSAPYMAGMIGGPLLALTVIFGLVLRRRKESDTVERKKSGAANRALKTLREAKKQTHEQALLTIISAMEKFVSDKFVIAPESIDGGMMRKQISSVTNVETAEAYAQLHSACQMGRYGGLSRVGNTSEVIAKAEELIKNIDRA